MMERRDLGAAGGKAHPHPRQSARWEKTQREYYLNEQMKAIQKELGDEEGKDELAEIEDKIKRTKLSRRRAREGPARAQEAASDVAHVGRGHRGAHYLDWLLSIPWEQETKGQEGSETGAEDPGRRSFWLEKVKERIVEYLAVQQRANKLTGPILCLGRPPRRRQDLRWVIELRGRPGATSCACRIGGVRDEAESPPGSPAHLYRFDAGQGRAVDAQGEVVEPALPAR